MRAEARFLSPSAGSSGSHKSARRSPVTRTTRRATLSDESPDGTLFEALRVHRSTLASEAGVAPFIVMHDRTLAEIALRRPTAIEDLAVPGMGPVKIAKYGEGLLRIVRRVAES